MKYVIRGLACFIVWIVFCFAATISPWILLLILFFAAFPWGWGYGKRVAKAMDRLLAALVGASGTKTVSAEIAERRKNCKVCTLVCHLFDWIDPNHCDDAEKYP